MISPQTHKKLSLHTKKSVNDLRFLPFQPHSGLPTGFPFLQMPHPASGSMVSYYFKGIVDCAGSINLARFTFLDPGSLFLRNKSYLIHKGSSKSVQVSSCGIDCPLKLCSLQGFGLLTPGVALLLILGCWHCTCKCI